MRARSVVIPIAAAILGVALWSLLRDSPAAEGPAGAGAPGLASPADEGDAGENQPAREEAAPGRAAAASGAPAAEPELPVWSGPPDREQDLHGVVLGEDGVPLPGAEVFVTRAWNRDMLLSRIGSQRHSAAIGSVLTSAGGEFRLRVARGGLYDVEARFESWNSRRAWGCSAGEFVTLRLAPPAAVHGAVSEASTGSPLADVQVLLYQPGSPTWSGETVTDADGRYRFDGVAAGEWGLALLPPRHEMPPWANVAVEAGGAVERNFILNPGATIRGRVVADGSRVPVPHAEVSDNWTFRRVARADADGRFEVRGWHLGEEWTALHARGPGYAQREFRARDLNLTEEVELPLLPSYAVMGRLLQSDGSPAAGASVAVFGSVNLGGVESPSGSVAEADADGGFTLSGIRTDVAQVLIARHDGEGLYLLRLSPPVQAGTAVDLGVLTFPAGGSLAGSLTRAAGAGPDSGDVELRGPDPGPSDPELQIPAELRSRVFVLRRRADDLGRFHFTGLRSGSYTLHVRSPGAPEHRQRVEIAPGQHVVLEPINMADGQAIGGRVLDHSGAPLPGSSVSILPENERGTRGTIRTRTGAAGEFHFAGLAAGAYRLAVEPPRTAGAEAGHLPERDRIVRAGETGLVLQLRRAGWITGEIASGPGLEAGHCAIRVLGADGARIGEHSAELSGAFRIPAPYGGAVRLEFWPRKLLPGREQDGIRIPAVSEAAVVLENVPEGARDLRVTLP